MHTLKLKSEMEAQSDTRCCCDCDATAAHSIGCVGTAADDSVAGLAAATETTINSVSYVLELELEF